MSATLTVKRESVITELGRALFQIALDGTTTGTINRHETFETPVDSARARITRARTTRCSYALAMSGNARVERGWIYIDGTRQDDGTIKLGTGGEMRFSPFEAISQRQEALISWGHILAASVQRLAFWRR